MYSYPKVIDYWFDELGASVGWLILLWNLLWLIMIFYAAFGIPLINVPNTVLLGIPSKYPPLLLLNE